MKVHLQWAVNSEDPRFKGDYNSEDYNDGVLREEILEVNDAEELKDLLLRFHSNYRVRTSHGWLEDYFYICYDKESMKDDLFEEDLNKKGSVYIKNKYKKRLIK